MRKAALLVVFAFFCVFCFGIKSSAKERDVGNVYTVVQDSCEYVLSEYEDGTPSAVVRGSALEIFSHILSLPEKCREMSLISLIKLTFPHRFL